MKRYALICAILSFLLGALQDSLCAFDRTGPLQVTITQGRLPHVDQRKTCTLDIAGTQLSYYPGRFFGENRRLSVPSSLGGGTLEYNSWQLKRALYILKGLAGVQCGDLRLSKTDFITNNSRTTSTARIDIC